MAAKKETFKRVVAAFVTFANQEAFERCITYFETGKDFLDYPTFQKRAFMLFGERLEVSQAPEPSNLIYENFEIDTKQRNKNKLKVFSLIALFFVGVFMLFAQIKGNVSDTLLKYPPNMDCKTFDYIEPERYQNLASEDMEHTLQMQGNGLYMCYCNKYGHIQDALHKEHLCYNYFYDVYMSSLNSNFITFLIVVINILIRVINITLIQSIGFTYESQQIMTIMTAIFYSQFINSGLLLLFTYANF